MSTADSRPSPASGMQQTFEMLAALEVDDVDGSDVLFEHALDIAKLKHYKPALWARLWAEWKRKKVRLLPELAKRVDSILKTSERKHLGGKDGFQRSSTGVVLPNRANTMLALAKMGIALSYDRFSGAPVVDGLPKLYSRLLDDHGENRIWASCEEQFGFRPSLSNLRIWLSDACYRNGFHPVQQYLDSVTWDGTPRIDTWLSRYCGAEDNEYTRAVGAIWLTAAVRRVRQPGCKFDELLILEGDQGADKSTAFATLAVREEWFSDSVALNASEKEMIESSSGVWIAEIAEMQGMRKGDVSRIKAQLSRQTDRARLAYGHLPTRAPRQCVYGASVNPEAVNRYLTDTTGNRRFWPVSVGRCDVEALRRDRDQLWAEAAAREASGASIRLPRELWPVAARVQAERTQGNAFADVLAEALGDMEGYIVASDGWRLLNIPIERRDQNAGKFGAAWKAMGWVRHNWRIDGRQTTVYVRGEGVTQEDGPRIVVAEDIMNRGTMRVSYERDYDTDAITDF